MSTNEQCNQSQKAKLSILEVGKETEQNNNRIQWVDSLKGFTIFCVTLGHLNMCPPVEKYIYSFHMFLFFFLSGYLFKVDRPTKDIVRKRINRILIPFIAWNIISAVAGYILKERDVWNFIEELFVLKGNLTYNAPIWFLLVLFITEIFVLFLRLYKYKWVAILTIIICCGLWVAFGHTWVLWKLNLVPMAMCFFLFGYLSKFHINSINKWYIIIPTGTMHIVFALLNVRIMYSYGRFGNYFYCIVAAVLGVLFYIGLFSRIPSLSRIKFLKSWGKNSLIIMAAQFPLFLIISIVSTKILGWDIIEYPNSLLSLALACLITAAISAAVTFIQNHTSKISFLKTICQTFGFQYT